MFTKKITILTSQNTKQKKLRSNMAEIVYMPKLSDTMTEGVVAEWTKSVGDDFTAW